MTDRLNLIYLTGLNTTEDGHVAAARRAIRFLANQTGADDSFKAAVTAVNTFQANPTVKLLVATTQDAALADRLMDVLPTYTDGLATFELNPATLDIPVPETDEEPQQPEESEEVEGFPDAAYNTALVLLSCTKGRPAYALIRCMQLGKATEDAELYAQAAQILLNVFQMDAGPNVHILGE